ncbi:MAG TPA: protein kinase, partial [Gemmatimonadaceae bacterium]
MTETANENEVEVAELTEQLRRVTLGRYDIYGVLGHGGMASVFLALDLSLDREVAIKVMSRYLLSSSEATERFRREAKISALLNHPHVVPIYAVGDSSELAYYVMKYVEGRSLDAIIREDGPQSVPFVQTVIAQTGAAIQFAHDRGVTHRDIKPANIMIEDGGWAVLADFGIARLDELQRLTSSGALMGTPHYMAPEQFSGTGITPAVDQYALGAVAYELLIGELPFTGTTLAEVMRGHLLDEPPSARATRPEVPELLDACIRRMLAKRAEDRFPSVSEAVTAFGAAPVEEVALVRRTMMTLAHSNAAARPRISVPVSPALGSQHAKGRPTPPATGWRRRLPWIAAGILLAAGLTAGVFAWRGSRDGPAAGASNFPSAPQLASLGAGAGEGGGSAASAPATMRSHVSSTVKRDSVRRAPTAPAPLAVAPKPTANGRVAAKLEARTSGRAVESPTAASQAAALAPVAKETIAAALPLILPPAPPPEPATGTVRIGSRLAETFLYLRGR